MPRRRRTVMPTEATTANKKCTLISSDGESFEVDVKVAEESQTIKYMIEDGCADGAIPLQNVTGKTLGKVIEYCKYHAEVPKGTDLFPISSADEIDIKKRDADFIDLEHGLFFDILLAAHYLDIKGLYDLLCQSIADNMKGKKINEIRKMYYIENDYTPEEEAAIQKQYPWAFE